MTDEKIPNTEPPKETPKEKYERVKRRKITLSFSPQEYSKIVEATKNDGTKRKEFFTDAETFKRRYRSVPAPSVYVKKIVLAHLKDGPVIPAYVTEELKNIRLEIARIGNNINQAVKLAQSLKGRKNFLGRPVDYSGELQKALEELRGLNELFKEYRTNASEKQ